MMKAYRVIIGKKEDNYGNYTIDKAEYFFNKEDAIKRYNEGIFYHKVTRITTYFADGTKNVGTMGEQCYERELKRAKPNQKVELVNEERNRFTIEEIEIQ